MSFARSSKLSVGLLTARADWMREGPDVRQQDEPYHIHRRFDQHRITGGLHFWGNNLGRDLAWEGDAVVRRMMISDAAEMPSM